MALYGYARVSSNDQDFTSQEQALRAAGCEVIRVEKATGTSRTGQSFKFNWISCGAATP
jgi:DNA invertase Pin-like site-specific DNA recombinase